MCFARPRQTCLTKLSKQNPTARQRPQILTLSLSAVIARLHDPCIAPWWTSKRLTPQQLQQQMPDRTPADLT